MYTRNQVLDAMPHVLSKAEQEIVSARWGLDSGKSLTLAEVWSKFGVTNEQLRAIESKVIQYIKGHR